MDFTTTTLPPDAEPMQTGQFEPTWNSLRKYEVPDWFRDAKFGIWAHWGPQCAPERGDWYARHMYLENHGQGKSHRARFGHPGEYGFKEVIRDWRADAWNPDELVAFYKENGAKYFFAMANHHDNLDLWNSKHQPWNSVNLGPKKDIVAGWAKAARDNDLRFGVSVHAAHAWIWYETAQGGDTTGDKAGVPYDGKLTKADGAGKWWEGYDPQDLYAQNHPLSNVRNVHVAWHWTEPGTAFPDLKYTQNIYDRTVDLINQHKPDAVYYDDTVLPLYPISDIGLKLAAHQYNSSMRWNDGKNEAVVMGKMLNEQQKDAMIWDVERGSSDKLEDRPWQTCTCLGGWHYDRPLYDRKGYKSATTVIHMLADIVSKNGNLLLSVPVRGDGSIDELEREIVTQIGDWLRVNGEAIYDTRPWTIFGEGPAIAGQARMADQGFNEGKGKPFTAQDIRFTRKGDVVYAIVLGNPADEVKIHSLGTNLPLMGREIKHITQLGVDAKPTWSRDADALVIQPVKIDALPGKVNAVVFRIE